MKKYLLISALAIAIILQFSCYSSNELQTVQQKTTSVLIMPIINSNGIYFRDDQVWHRLVWSLQSNGFNVINDESVWNKMIDAGYELSQLTDAQVLEISKMIKVDLIIFKNSRLGVSKVFDCNKGEFVVYEDMIGSKGYDVRLSGSGTMNSGDLKYTGLVMKLKGLGY